MMGHIAEDDDWTNAKTDLAVVKVEADHVVAAKWGNSDELQKGDWIMAFGSPFGYVGSMTHGIVSALNRTGVGILGQNGYENFIQVDAPINPGNSGGPLVNVQGEVVGINTAIASRNGGFQGIGFAIPSNQAKFVYAQLKEKGKVTRGWLGVSIMDVAREASAIKQAFHYTSNDGVFVQELMPGAPDELAEKYGLSQDMRKGAVVTEVKPRSGAFKAGLRPGDVITEVAGKPVTSAKEAAAAISKEPSDKILLLYVNGAAGARFVFVEPTK